MLFASTIPLTSSRPSSSPFSHPLPCLWADIFRVPAVLLLGVRCSVWSVLLILFFPSKAAFVTRLGYASVVLGVGGTQSSTTWDKKGVEQVLMPPALLVLRPSFAGPLAWSAAFVAAMDFFLLHHGVWVVYLSFGGILREINGESFFNLTLYACGYVLWL